MRNKTICPECHGTGIDLKHVRGDLSRPSCEKCEGYGTILCDQPITDLLFSRKGLYLLITVYILALSASVANAPTVEAPCDTDTDCMRFCPPPSDDPECDGGPQS